MKHWTVASCEIDLRPEGRFHTVMRSPEGQEFPNAGRDLGVSENPFMNRCGDHGTAR